MKKQINSLPTRARKLITIGIVMIIASPFISPLFYAIASSGCPLVEGQRECGLQLGYKLSSNALLSTPIWLIIAIALIISGFVVYKNSKKLR
jgi:energy-converting hydrogenase Eha subunit C